MQPRTPPLPQKGDLNGDNQITTADAVIALAIAAGGSASCDAATLAAADVSGDNRVTSLDALMILQEAAGGIAL
ncbi:MAG: dockerin type I repeat-containing protein [Euryarchaeota archaeon]|nr:dockerin type I repeat-containing protein [Euryarchaeota archaeon]